MVPTYLNGRGMTYETKKKIRAMISKGFNHGFFFQIHVIKKYLLML